MCAVAGRLCVACRLRGRVRARVARPGVEHELPTPRPKKVRPQRVVHIVILTREDNAVLLERRPPVGVWGGLWMFPQFESSESAYGWL